MLSAGTTSSSSGRPGTPMASSCVASGCPLLSDELPEPDGDPIRTRTLARTSSPSATPRQGRHRGCLLPHRRAPLFFGRNEECGLRCVYHGWKFDADGRCLDMPNEPPESSFKDRIQLKSYRPPKSVASSGSTWARRAAADAPPSSRSRSCRERAPRLKSWSSELAAVPGGRAGHGHVSFCTTSSPTTGPAWRAWSVRTLHQRSPPAAVHLDRDYGFVYAAGVSSAGNYYWRVTQSCCRSTPSSRRRPATRAARRSGCPSTTSTAGASWWRSRTVEGEAVSSGRRCDEPGTFRFRRGGDRHPTAVYRRGNRYGLNRQTQRK